RASPCARTSPGGRGSAQGEGADPVDGAVEAVVVADGRAGRGVLPHRVGAPAGGQFAHGGGVPGDPQRGRGGEARVVAGALLPPARRRVDHGVACGARPVAVQEVADPSHHPAGRLAVACVAVRVPLDVERARQGPAVGTPAAAVVDEVVRLGGAARGVGGREVVGAADHAHVVGAVVLLPEVGVAVVRALGGLDEGPFHSAVPQRLPGDVALVAGDVHALRLGDAVGGRGAVAAVVGEDAHAHVGGAARGGDGAGFVGQGRVGEGEEREQGRRRDGRAGGAGYAGGAGRAGGARRAGSAEGHGRVSVGRWAGVGSAE